MYSKKLKKKIIPIVKKVTSKNLNNFEDISFKNNLSLEDLKTNIYKKYGLDHRITRMRLFIATIILLYTGVRISEGSEISSI